MSLSHGQASIKWNFSTNKNMEVGNLEEWSYISLRIIKEYVEYCGSVLQVPIIKDLVFASCGRQRYMLHLKKQRKENKNKWWQEKKTKRKT